VKGLIEHSLTGLERLDKKRTAILGIHWQVDAVKPEGILGPTFAAMVSETGVIQRTREVFAAARKAGMPVIYVNVCYWPQHADLVRNNALFNAVAEKNGFVRGTRGVQVIDDLPVQPADFIVEHSRISSFYGSDLVSVLTARNIRTVVATGIATNVAVDHTIRDAVQLGFDAILLEDCCTSASRAHHDAALLTLRVLATQVTDAKSFLRVIA
jgi:nicotinamidase-related amidase